MALEIERKFLVVGDGWRGLAAAVYMRQAYLNSCPDRIVRVRIEGDRAFLTVKGRSVGISRLEWEYPIPVEQAQDMLGKVCERPSIEKYRHRIAIGAHVWEVDEFLGDNLGLCVAEIELSDENEVFVPPSWLGAEVSHDHRYANAQLVKHPYLSW